MKSVYLDNAATTKMSNEVIQTMYTSMQENYGNPSSTHQFGRKAKTIIETARKNIAKHLNVSAAEIIFTSSGTEANNLILFNAVLNLKVKRIVTSKIEHHAVLNTCIYLAKTYNITIDYVKLDKNGVLDSHHLESLVKDNTKKTLVSLMFINNEIGNILEVEKLCSLFKKYNVLFHSDTVQAIGHYHLDLQKIPIDFIVASAHKFHGPKGVGFAYIKKGFGILPIIHGGGQERGTRAGTENVHAILGMEKALRIAVDNLEKDKEYLTLLKEYFIKKLQTISNTIKFNGLSIDVKKSSYTILNVRFPIQNDLLLFALDIAGIAVSGGSACQSGSNKGSHVLSEVLGSKALNDTSIRFSLSKTTTKADIDFTISKITENL